MRSTTPSLVAALALCGAVPALHAAGFTPVNQQRDVQIGADISIQNADGSPVGSGSASDRDATAAGYFGAWDAEVGLDGGPLGDVGFAGGRAVQRSSITAQRIDFYGFADIFVSVSGSGDVISGGGAASTYFGVGFDLDEATTVRLDMQSTPSLFGNDFLFSLTRSDGSLVWGASSVEQPGGPPLYDFARTFVLDAGRYQLGAYLAATTTLDGGGDPRAEALFSLATAVPEPGAVAMWVAGLAGLAAAVARRRGRMRGDSCHAGSRGS